MRRFIGRVVVLLALVAGSGGGLALWWLNQPLSLNTSTLELEIGPGTSTRGVAQAAVAAGVQTDATLLYWWFRLSGQSRRIKAGNYALAAPVSPRGLLQILVRGQESLRSVTLLEGWTFHQVRAALSKAEHLKHDTKGMHASSIMILLGRPGLHPEGRFFPDTYTYAKSSSDLALLARALRAMDKKLDAAWSMRQADSPLKTPEQALILASIIEKETGVAVDRPMIASVFVNRLALGMLLQTDPSVIYGLGERFDGNLTKRHLQTDTPWNTYTRTGLPPTPIAMPGAQSLLAAVQPAASRALYFVARGDGSSQFSNSLEEHNRAVNKYQR